jgi:hypothetical protein
MHPIALHELDPEFRRVTLENDKIKTLVRELGFHRDPVGKYMIHDHKIGSDSFINDLKHSSLWSYSNNLRLVAKVTSSVLCLL